MNPLQTDIERRLAHTEPDIEVLLAEVVGGKCLRVFIDHPNGVTLAADGGVVAIPYSEIRRSNLIEE